MWIQKDSKVTQNACTFLLGTKYEYNNKEFWEAYAAHVDIRVCNPRNDVQKHDLEHPGRLTHQKGFLNGLRSHTKYLQKMGWFHYANKKIYIVVPVRIQADNFYLPKQTAPLLADSTHTHTPSWHRGPLYNPFKVGSRQPSPAVPGVFFFHTGQGQHSCRVQKRSWKVQKQCPAAGLSYNIICWRLVNPVLTGLQFYMHEL